MANLIENRASGKLQVRGGDYPISQTRQTISKIVSGVQLGLVGMILAGMDRFLPDQIRENKFAAGILVWFIGNAITSGLTNTGAFEIYKGQDLVWSTLEEGGLPNYIQLVAAFQGHGVNLDTPKESSR